jgi:hypothetical protein
LIISLLEAQLERLQRLQEDHQAELLDRREGSKTERVEKWQEKGWENGN